MTVDHRLPWHEAAALDAWAAPAPTAVATVEAAAERWRRAREAYRRLGAPDRWLEGVGR